MSRIRAGRAEVELGVKDKLKKGLARAKKRLKKFAVGAAKLGVGAVGIGAGLAAGFAPAIMKASEFQETMSKFSVVFGARKKEVQEWGDNFAKEVGRSKTQVAGFLASSQDLLVPMGVDPETALESSKTITQLATDLASFNNMTDAKTMEDLQAALTGSGEVMKKYGVIVNETAVKQEMLNSGLDPKAATEADKAMARLNIIMRGTTAAQGDAIRTGDSFANQMKAVKASFDDFLVTVGTPFLDWLAKFAGGVREHIDAARKIFEDNFGFIKALFTDMELAGEVFMLTFRRAVGTILDGLTGDWVGWANDVAKIVSELGGKVIDAAIQMGSGISGVLGKTLQALGVENAEYFQAAWGGSTAAISSELKKELTEIAEITAEGLGAAFDTSEIDTKLGQLKDRANRAYEVEQQKLNTDAPEEPVVAQAAQIAQETKRRVDGAAQVIGGFSAKNVNQRAAKVNSVDMKQLEESKRTNELLEHMVELLPLLNAQFV